MNSKDKVRTVKLKCGIEVLVDFGRKVVCECGTDIWFGRTKRKRWMPINLVGLVEWDTHYADCPLANKFRRKRKGMIARRLREGDIKRDN